MIEGFSKLANVKIRCTLPRPRYVWFERINKTDGGKTLFVCCYELDGLYFGLEAFDYALKLGGILSQRSCKFEEELSLLLDFVLKFGPLGQAKRSIRDQDLFICEDAWREIVLSEDYQFSSFVLSSLTKYLPEIQDKSVLLFYTPRQLKKRIADASNFMQRRKLPVFNAETGVYSIVSLAPFRNQIESSIREAYPQDGLVLVVGESVFDYSFFFSDGLFAVVKDLSSHESSTMLNLLLEEYSREMFFQFEPTGELTFRIETLRAAITFKLMYEAHLGRIGIQRCKVCGAFFIPKRRSQLYCSSSCRVKAFKLRKHQEDT